MLLSPPHPTQLYILFVLVHFVACQKLENLGNHVLWNEKRVGFRVVEDELGHVEHDLFLYI